VKAHATAPVANMTVMSTPECKNGLECPWLKRGTCKKNHSEKTEKEKCKNGPCCRWQKLGICRFDHPETATVAKASVAKASVAKASVCFSDFTLTKSLGHGMSGDVMLGVHKKTSERIAIKRINTKKLGTQVSEILQIEICILRKISGHEGVSQLLFVENTPSETQIGLELIENGELFDYIDTAGYLSESIARTIFLQLGSALNHCHDNNIYHRDIKLENILLDSRFRIKLIDFGLSTMTETYDAPITGRCGTPQYCAPEVWTNTTYSGIKADTWSALVVLFLMLSGNYAFGDKAARGYYYYDILETRFWEKHKKIAPHLPDRTEYLFFKGFMSNPRRRDPIKEILCDPWFLAPPIAEEEFIAKMTEIKQKIVKR